MANPDLLTQCRTMRLLLSNLMQSIEANGLISDNYQDVTGSTILATLQTDLTTLTNNYNSLAPNYNLGTGIQ